MDAIDKNRGGASLSEMDTPAPEGAEDVLKTLRMKAAQRQAKWRAGKKLTGIVEKSFTIAAADVEMFKLLAEKSRLGIRP